VLAVFNIDVFLMDQILVPVLHVCRPLHDVHLASTSNRIVSILVIAGFNFDVSMIQQILVPVLHV
jgi:hypothetical protein